MLASIQLAVIVLLCLYLAAKRYHWLAPVERWWNGRETATTRKPSAQNPPKSTPARPQAKPEVRPLYPDRAP